MSDNEKPSRRSADLYERLNGYIHNNPGITFVLQVAVAILILLILVLLIWLLTRGSTDEEPIPEPPKEMIFDRNDYFLPDQIILTGPDVGTIQSALDTALEEAGYQRGIVTLVEESIIRINLSENNTLGKLQGNSSNKSFVGNQICSGISNQSSFTIVLAQFEDGSITVEDLINAIDTLQINDVAAEPNFLTGSPDYPAGGTTFFKSEVATQKDYISQWAFDKIEREVPDVDEAGNGVHVVVLDSVPAFLAQEESVPEAASGRTTTFLSNLYDVNWVEVDPNAAMSLKVGYAHEFGLPVAEADLEGMDLSHHGLFVAQMVHSIAPAADIELVQVLNSRLRGNLYTLILGFYDNVLNENLDSPPNIVNMSLGIHIPPPQANFQLPTLGTEALHTVVQLAHCRNILVVASSGNNSILSYPPQLANVPADWSSVIAVAASNVANQRSCFSNQGDIAAPGGDGRMPDDPIPSSPPPLGCKTRLEKCPSMGGNCPYAIVGPMADANTKGLIFWNGSSFASPMVAGLAARVLDEGSGDLSPDEVRHIIECGATEATFPMGISGHPDRHIGEGVINVKRTLEECMP